MRFRKYWRNAQSRRGGNSLADDVSAAGCEVSPVRGNRANRKVLQLCRQVAVTLDGVLADCGDLVLQNLHVASVAPFPDGSRLLVTVASVDGLPARVGAPEVVLEHLNHASGHLRREIALAVTRKRTPLLVYRLAVPALYSTGG